ncbi:glycoside hydrolase family 127 protein [Flavihumibacter sp. RY-1]|uniref:Glycoside hydrolase family 127 protein n=1 Tax=Flavihumibacter fluminis TaxID=2909236 RepID=A0ABS9BFT0_9BACT|nr:glycoside hydrolase family 127 protein [Flavihumibacter fluminis]MCF1713694.1 glycoside hydrolase family 127 protein [Flavihumibacter fluminis]
MMRKILLSVIVLSCGMNALAQNTLQQQLASMNAALQLRFNTYDEQRYSRLIQSTTAKLSDDSNAVQEVYANCVVWKVKYHTKPVPGYKDLMEVQVDFLVSEGEVNEASVSLDLVFDHWRTENFVLAPAALYNGNRFEARVIPYSPKLSYYATGYKNPAEKEKDVPVDIGRQVPTIISDVPRLSLGNGVSRVQFRSGDMSTPAIGFYSPSVQRICWMLTEQGNQLGDYGIDIEETKDRSRAIISLTAPVVREMYQYKITTTREPSIDRGYHFRKGDAFSIRVYLYTKPADDLQELFNTFSSLRTLPVYDRKMKQELPFSMASKIMFEGLNRNDWNEAFNYYSVGSWKRWTPGWTGGFQLLYSLLLSKQDSLTRERIIRNLRFAFTHAVAPSGFFWDAIEKDIPVPGDFRRPHTRNWHLVRRSADGLYYALQLMQYLDGTDKNWAVKFQMPDGYRDTIRRVADAFFRQWQKEGQLGQFVDNYTGEIIVGGSASGSLVPAALALSASYYKEPKFLDAAKSMMRYFDTAFIRKGYTTGGPGDALQNPDSESAYSMVESAVALYEATGEKEWLDIAERMTVQFATWVSSYNYRFPSSSSFGKLGILSNGAVWANTQNKHGSPNICTHGGLGLLKLYLATGDPFYRDLLRDIVHNCVQYISRKDKPIGAIPPGGVDERCSTTDWLEGIGEVMNQTTWAQIANMLSVNQLPGMVVKRDGSFVVLDHLDVKPKGITRKAFEFEVHNATLFDAELKVFVETGIMNVNQPASFMNFSIKAGERKLLRVSK